LPRPAVHPVQKAIRGAHPRLVVSILVMQRRHVRADDRLGLCLYPFT
jgi:hypothetical protein